MSDTFSGFLVNLNRLIDGENVSVSEIPQLSLRAIVQLGEARVYRETRSRYNEKYYETTVTSNLAPLPDDFVANSVINFGFGPLSPVSEETAMQLIWDQRRSTVQYFAEAGPNFLFAPAIDDGTPVLGRYFARLPNLSETTTADNPLYQANQDLFTYACLCESAPFFGQDKRMPLWESKYEAIRDQINEEKIRAAYSTGRIQMRPSALLGSRRRSNVANGESGVIADGGTP